MVAALLGALPGLGNGGFSRSPSFVGISGGGGSRKSRLSSSSSSSSPWGVIVWSSALGALLGVWASDVIDAMPQSLEALVVAQVRFGRVVRMADEWMGATCIDGIVCACVPNTVVSFLLCL